MDPDSQLAEKHRHLEDLARELYSVFPSLKADQVDLLAWAFAEYCLLEHHHKATQEEFSMAAAPLLTPERRIELETQLGNDLYAALSPFYEAIELETGRRVIGNGHHAAQDMLGRVMGLVRAGVDANIRRAQAVGDAEIP